MWGVRMSEFLKVVTYQEAINRIKDCFPAWEFEYVDLISASGRVAVDSLEAPEDLPAFNRSTVDGYAVNAADCFGCSETLPAYLEYVGEVKMGKRADIKIKKGQTCWVPTGGMIPDGADAVVMVEYTEKLGNDTILINRPVSPNENLMFKGEDVRAGDKLIGKGRTLRPQDIGFLASLGITGLKVYKPLNIGIISSGDEIIPIYKHPAPGQIRDVNSYSLAAAVKSGGGNANIYPIAADEFTALKEAIMHGLDNNNLLLLSGGSSVGIADLTIDVLMSIPGSSLLFHGLAVKPGKPTLGVKIDNKLVIGLPGHPVSALMMFYIICGPFMHYTTTQKVKAMVSQNIASQPGRDDFIPVALENSSGQTIARPLLGKSGLMSILSRADAYIHIPYEQQGILMDTITTAYLF